MVAWLLACGLGGAPADVAVIRPGDALLDHLDYARIESYPETNLPPQVAALVGTTVTVIDPLVREDWDIVSLTPEHRDRFRAYGAVREYTNRPTLSLAPFADPAVLVRDGEPEPRWDEREQPFPGSTASYVRRRREIVAYSTGVPQGLALRYSAVPRAFFEGVEPSSSRRPDSATDLRSRYQLDGVSREGLLLPAPGAVAFRLPAVPGELHFTVGVVNRSWRVLNGALTPAPGLSDGVEFRVEAAAEGETDPGAIRVLWSRLVTPGEGFVQVRVDLSAYAGKGLTLRLVSDPGPKGNAFFDYAFWGAPRLRGRPARPAARPHVVLIDIDTLRADRVGPRSGARDLTPRLDRWAERHARVFSQAWSSSTWTLPSTVSILTGLSVTQHQVALPNKKLTAAHRFLGRILSEAGYETYALTEGGYVSSDFGFADGFDVFDGRQFQDVDWPQAFEWLAERRRSEHPFFLFIQTYSVHDPFEPDPRFLPRPDYGGSLAGKAVTAEDVIHPFGEKLLSLSAEERDYIQRLYDAGVQRFDEALGVFLETLEQEFAGEELLVVITSDHGEEFFERGSAGHGSFSQYYEELLHVPLIVRFPDARAERIDEPASTLDIVPTVLDVVGLAVPPHLSGRSLRGAVEPRVVVAEVMPGFRALRLGDLRQEKTRERGLNRATRRRLRALGYLDRR